MGAQPLVHAECSVPVVPATQSGTTVCSSIFTPAAYDQAPLFTLRSPPHRAARHRLVARARTRFSMPRADSVPVATMVLQLLLPLEPTQNVWRSFDSFGPNQAGAVPQSLSVQGVLAQPKPGADLTVVWPAGRDEAWSGAVTPPGARSRPANRRTVPSSRPSTDLLANTKTFWTEFRLHCSYRT